MQLSSLLARRLFLLVIIGACLSRLACDGALTSFHGIDDGDNAQAFAADALGLTTKHGPMTPTVDATTIAPTVDSTTVAAYSSSPDCIPGADCCTVAGMTPRTNLKPLALQH